MIKKRVLCCSALLTVMLLSNLYSKTQPESPDPFKRALGHAMKVNVSIALAESKKNKVDDLYSQISFAEEAIPLDEVAVKQRLDKYLRIFAYLKRPNHQIHNRANQLLTEFEKILKSYGVPEDLKYIAGVESSLNPKTTSHKGAGGYWQFMPATARLYG